MNNLCALSEADISDLLDALEQQEEHKFVINNQWAVKNGHLLFEPIVDMCTNRVNYADMGIIRISYHDIANNILGLETEDGCAVKFKVSEDAEYTVHKC